MEARMPRVGVGVILQRKGKVLLLKRKNAHGDGTWAFIGGHLEYGESPEECAVREVMEEIGIEITNPRAVDFTNDHFPKDKRHYITIFVLAEPVGEEEIREPEKIESLRWFDWNDFPEPLFTPVKNLREKGFTLRING